MTILTAAEAITSRMSVRAFTKEHNITHMELMEVLSVFILTGLPIFTDCETTEEGIEYFYRTMKQKWEEIKRRR